MEPRRGDEVAAVIEREAPACRRSLQILGEVLLLTNATRVPRLIARTPPRHYGRSCGAVGVRDAGLLGLDQGGLRGRIHLQVNAAAAASPPPADFIVPRLPAAGATTVQCPRASPNAAFATDSHAVIGLRRPFQSQCRALRAAGGRAPAAPRERFFSPVAAARIDGVSTLPGRFRFHRRPRPQSSWPGLSGPPIAAGVLV